MADKSNPDAPPSYALATGSSTASKTNRLEVPGAHNGIPAASRRSMEDEHRPLPEGWVRQWDDKEKHQYFVDTKANPPRSSWIHPHDDENYLNTLTSEQRERIQEEESSRMYYDHSDDESTKKKPISAQNTSSQASTHASSNFPADLPPRTGSTTTTGKVGFAEKMKQKVTGQTKEEREKSKLQREQEEREYYEAHVKFRQAMQQAQMTGQPVWFARDPQGRDVYVEPPSAYGGAGAIYNGGAGRGYGNNGYGYNPYQSGPYANPNARFIRPPGAYAGRPYGGRPGGGMGMPIAGGLLGGMLLGGLMF